MIFVVALALSSVVSEILVHDITLLPPVLVVCLLLSLPLILDLWAKVSADRAGIEWRNRFRTKRLEWPDVAGFQKGPVSMELCRTNGKTVPLRVLGLRYFGSKKLAVQRVAVLERLRSGH